VDDEKSPTVSSAENAADVAPEAFSESQPRDAVAQTPPKRRFSWPFRLFLGFFLFDMVTRSLITLTPFDRAWRESLEVAKAPLRLPTRQQLAKIEAGGDEKYDSVPERYWAVLRSAFKFVSPLPTSKTAPHLDSAGTWARYVVVWVGTRLNFMGALFGLDQNWPMFSPNVRRTQVVPRVKLLYEDGTRHQVWLLGEPSDLTRFHRWFVKRPLQIDLRLHQDWDARLGVSRNLAQRFAHSASGSRLVSIEMYEVKYNLPKPGEDAQHILAKQSAKPTPAEPFWRYDVAKDEGKTFKKDDKKDDKKDKAKKGEAKPAAEPLAAGVANDPVFDRVPEELQSESPDDGEVSNEGAGNEGDDGAEREVSP
jgi:hypothetical protein